MKLVLLIFALGFLIGAPTSSSDLPTETVYLSDGGDYNTGGG